MKLPSIPARRRQAKLTPKLSTLFILKGKKNPCAKQEGQEGSDSELPENYFLANVNTKESQAFLDFAATGYLR